MKDCEFCRLVQQICFLLNLSQPATHQVIEYYRKLAASETHSFRPEVIIAACIFLVAKVREQEHKIRDILNICYVVTTMYKLANLREKTTEIQYLSLRVKRGENLEMEQIIPNFSLQRYNDFKKLILQAEQHLLRVLSYDLDTSRQRNYKLLLCYLKYFKLPKSICQLAMKLYNDSVFAQLEENPKACLYTAVRVGIEAGMVKEVDGRLLEREWWESVMGCRWEELMAYGEKLMEYYLEEDVGKEQQEQQAQQAQQVEQIEQPEQPKPSKPQSSPPPITQQPEQPVPTNPQSQEPS